MTDFAAWLTRKMDRAGIDIATLAAELDVSYDTIASWRTGRREPGSRLMMLAVKDAVRRLSR